MDEFILSTLQNYNVLLVTAIIAVFLWLIGKGADMVVEEAVELSVSWGIPKIIIGSTIVSLGTTLPEASVSVMAAINGEPGLALGNAIGSIIADTGLIMGICVVIGLVPVVGKTIKKQSIIQFAVALLLILATFPYNGFSKGGNVSQIAGIGFVILLVVYVAYSILNTRNVIGLAEDSPKNHKKSTASGILRLIFGIIIIIISSKILIPAIQIVAVKVGIPESIIGATLVAFGTSLPELVTSIRAVRKGHGQLAIGNVIGADILNVLFVVGASAAVSPEGLAVPDEFLKIQIPFMLAVIVILRVSIIKSKEYISKTFGYLLLAIYGLYLLATFIL